MSVEGILNPLKQGRFVRQTGHSISVGKVVAYAMVGSPAPFTVTISREGIEIRGMIKAPSEGVAVIIDVLQRASKHYEHLKSFAVGEPQTILDEATLINESNDTLAVAEGGTIRVQ